YATLSHCWGSMSHIRYQATTSTLLSLKERIPYKDLPRTYCDAISVCRALKIRYLWIDSLCIIQDSKEDWAREAANMAHVYSNSSLTISADWSTNSDGGCFKASSGELRKDLDSAIYDHKQLDWTHLAGRAWVYQERLLSRHNLHFARDQLFWECRIVSRNRGSIDNALYVWCRIVEKYSGARITLPTDRLPAISALANLTANHPCCSYLAGL
ncbi:HET-domain-containing protein, partial [Hyaloscypha hepaticicola]